MVIPSIVPGQQYSNRWSSAEYLYRVETMTQWSSTLLLVGNVKKITSLLHMLGKSPNRFGVTFHMIRRWMNLEEWIALCGRGAGRSCCIFGSTRRRGSRLILSSFNDCEDNRFLNGRLQCNNRSFRSALSVISFAASTSVWRCRRNESRLGPSSLMVASNNPDYWILCFVGILMKVRFLATSWWGV